MFDTVAVLDQAENEPRFDAAVALVADLDPATLSEHDQVRLLPSAPGWRTRQRR